MQNNSQKKRLPLVLGSLCWVLCFFLRRPASPFEIDHVVILLLAAPLWLIPMAFQVLELSKLLLKLVLPAVFLFTASFLLEKSSVTAILTLPWLFLAAYAMYNQFLIWRRKEKKALGDHSQLAAFVYLPVGVAWAFADRLGMQPMGFSPTITLLTAVHFHYAGFLLPLLSALLLKEKTIFKQREKIAAWGIILGVPLTALGITTTQFQLPQVIEIVCVTVMATSALLMGFAYLHRGWQFRTKLIGVLWGLCGLALMSGMTLALAYGWRTVVVIPQLTIPWMYAIHGTLNAVGFALPGVLAWYLSKEEKKDLDKPVTETITTSGIKSIR